MEIPYTLKRSVYFVREFFRRNGIATCKKCGHYETNYVVIPAKGDRPAAKTVFNHSCAEGGPTVKRTGTNWDSPLLYRNGMKDVCRNYKYKPLPPPECIT